MIGVGPPIKSEPLAPPRPLGNASREAPLRIPLVRVASVLSRMSRKRGWTLERPHTRAAAGAAARGC